MSDETKGMPGEVWRDPDGSCAVTLKNGVPFTWIEGKDGLNPTQGNVMPAIILSVWAMAERSRAEQAERDARLAATLTKAAQERADALARELADARSDLAAFRAVSRDRT